MRSDVRSYRDLPMSLYQIQVKFRDEVRPRFGLLRGREFIMKDAYSFHATQESLQAHYDAMCAAYGRICERCGLDTACRGRLRADRRRGYHEFMALAENGEAEIVYCACGWAADVEAPRRRAAHAERHRAQPMERVQTPEIRTIAELSAFLGVPARHARKRWLTRRGTGGSCR